MTEPHAMKSASDRSDRSDPLGIVDLFRSEKAVGHLDRSDHDKSAGPIGPNGATEARTAKSEANQRGPNGPAGPTGYEGAEAARPRHAFSPQYAREARMAPDEGEAFPYGTACNLGDTPRTWTGRVVSLAAWKRLNEWEKHGPNGRIWCGLCRYWHMPGDCTGGEP